MALDPANEARELDAILSSPDDPDTKRARIAQLYGYGEPAMNDPRGMPMGATAGLERNLAAEHSARDAAIHEQTATDAAQPLVVRPYEPSGYEQAAKISTDVPEGATLIKPGKAGIGQLARDIGLYTETPAPFAETPIRPAPDRVTTIPETTVKAAPVKPGAGGAGAGGGALPEWLVNEMSAPESYYGRPDLIGRPVTKQEDAGYRALEQAQYEGTREQAEAENQAIQAGARAELAAVERGQIVDAELARRELERQNNLAAMERGFQEMLGEAAREPIDSDRLWNNKSTGEKILSKLALFIGTIGAGASTGNPMLMINKMDADVDRDIQAQKANKAFAMHRLAAEGTLYGMARDRFASEGAVDAAMRETAWRRIGAELNAFKIKAQDPQRQAAIQLLIDGTESKILDAERQRRLLNDSDTIARARAAAAGRAGKPPPRNEVKGLIEGLSVQDGIIKKLERMKSLTGPTMNRVWGSTEKGEAETLRKKLQLDYKRGEETGTLDKGSLDFFDSMIGTPEDFFRNPNSEAKLDQLIQDARAKQIQLQRDFETLQNVKTGPATKAAGGGK